MSFHEITGQKSAVAFLKTAFKSERMAHAYMFVGPRGVGKKEAALNFAKLFFCENVQGEEPCDQCGPCHRVMVLKHPDVIWVNREGQYIKIDAVRQACQRLSLKGFESARKIMIVPEAECLNEESSNALLKTLEEPTPHTVIILLVTQIKRLLPTIASRCQRVVFSSLTEDDLVSVLKEKFRIEEAEAFYLARVCEGSLGVALTHHRNGLFQRKNQIIQDIFNKGQGLDGFMTLGGLDRSQRQAKVDELLCVLLAWFRDLMMAKVSLSTGDFINVDTKEEIVQKSEVFSLKEIEARIRAIAEARVEQLHNVNTRLSLSKLRAELWK